MGAVWLGLRALPKLGPTSRYTLWLCTLIALVTIPILSAFATGAAGEPKAALPAVALHQPRSLGGAPQSGPFSKLPNHPEAADAASVPAAQSVAAQRARPIVIPQTVVLAVALLWLLVTFGRMLRLLADFRAIHAIRRDGKVWSRTHDFPIYLSDRVSVPLAIGFLRPAVILPSSIFEHVDERALEAVIIHEIAHLHRYDVWTNALARVSEALLTLNPASWLVMRRLSIERELACDDCVVARTGDGNAFARALAAMAGLAGGRVPIAAAGAIGSRHFLVVRIERLLDSRPRRLQLSLSALGGVLMLLALIAFTVQAVSPALAFAPQGALPQQLTPATSLAANCSQRDSGPLRDHTLGPAGPRMIRQSLSADFLASSIKRYPATITYSIAVDAAGHQHDFKTLHSSNNTAVDEQVRRWVMESTFKPAVHNCVAVAGTFTSGASRLPAPSVLIYSRPATPVIYGKSEQKSVGGCAVPHRNPAMARLVKPQMSDAMKQRIAATQTTFLTSVNVHLTASGAVSRAAMQHSSGQKMFDDAALAAAERSTYAPRIVNCHAVAGDYYIMAAFTEWMEP